MWLCVGEKDELENICSYSLCNLFECSYISKRQPMFSQQMDAFVTLTLGGSGRTHCLGRSWNSVSQMFWLLIGYEVEGHWLVHMVLLSAVSCIADHHFHHHHGQQAGRCCSTGSAAKMRKNPETRKQNEQAMVLHLDLLEEESRALGLPGPPALPGLCNRTTVISTSSVCCSQASIQQAS